MAPVTISTLCVLSFASVAYAQDADIALLLNGVKKDTLSPTDIASFMHKEITRIHDAAYHSEIEKMLWCDGFTSTDPCMLTDTVARAFTTRTTFSTATANTSAVTAFVTDLARRINTDPVNARLRFNEQTHSLEEIAPHQDGIAIDVDDTVAHIIALLTAGTPLPSTMELIATTLPAKVTSANAHSLGITDRIGTGTSNFRGSTNARIHNITVSANRFDGILIAPNEEFSFVKILGPVDAAHGYTEELVIRDNETKPEFGGGICQVSTTMFRSAINTGMKITQRRNHSYPVQYYSPIGFDAAIYVPAPDFRFVNNTPGYILINLAIVGSDITFTYYGTHDGRTVTMDGPHVIDRQPDGAMKTTFTQKVTAKDGTTIIDDIFKSNYKSPKDYPRPGDVAKLTEKPKDWSKKQWDDYIAQNGR